MKVLKLSQKQEVPLFVKGQGIYFFDYNINDEKLSNTDAVFYFYNQSDTDGLEIKFTKTDVQVQKISEKTNYLNQNEKKSGLTPLVNAYYWFSLDAQNQVFYAGIGEARLETIIYSYKFIFGSDTQGQQDKASNKAFLESIVKISCGNTNSIKLVKDPVTQKVPLKIMDSSKMTLDLIASGEYLSSVYLPPTSLKLYESVSGSNMILDTPDFPNFTRAIEHSIRTPGLWCYNKLREKATEFNKDKPNYDETYLRITLGQNNGESPGVPYVMEIWPPGHYSPIHSHAGAEAIIRILSGSINVNLYPFLCGEAKPFANANFGTNEYTWVSSGLNQTHQLKNISSDTTCVSLNCYLYSEINSVHYDYFDYLDVNGLIERFEPDSDMDFLSFKALMKEEWDSSMKKKNTKKLFRYNYSV